MKITVILGSPKIKSSSSLLAEKFVEGAREAGHDTYIFDSAHEEVKACQACDYCLTHNSECVQKDAMISLYERLLESEIIVFATPLHYFTFSAQIKVLISRFHAKNAQLRGNKGAVLLVTSSKTEGWALEGLERTYEAMLRFLDWEDMGRILAVGCRTLEATEESTFLEEAYNLGRNIGKELEK